jgi:DNA-binding transcriptional ArsR family regulator
MHSEPALDLVQDARSAAAMLDPLRLRLLGELGEPDSASGLARRLRIPRQKINYHLRELEKRRLVELVGERRRGNCTERMVRATARSYLISPEALGPLAADPEKIQDHFSSAYLVAVAARAMRDVGLMRVKAEKAGKKLATLTLEAEVRFSSAADRNAFAEELAAQVARLASKYHQADAPGGRSFKFVVAGYPALHSKSQD